MLTLIIGGIGYWLLVVVGIYLAENLKITPSNISVKTEKKIN
jgi:hypothetical protein